MNRKSTSSPLTLNSQEVHIWNVYIPQQLDRLDVYWHILSTDEQEKAQRFRFQKDKNCSIIARAILRELLAEYLEIDSKKIEFKYTEKGKPYLTLPKNIYFNISHSKDCIALAFSKTPILGVDIEYTEHPIEVLSVASSFFSETENQILKNLPLEQHQKAFYTCWTRKEAFIKATGDGLSFPLKEFSVSFQKNTYPQLLETLWDINEKKRWTLEAFIPFKNYIGAIAIRNNNRALAIKYFTKN